MGISICITIRGWRSASQRSSRTSFTLMRSHTTTQPIRHGGWRSAMARVPGATHVLIAGDGPQRNELLRFAGIHNIGGSVEIVGSIPSTQMPDFYRNLDVVVLPSRTRANWKEQFGRMLIEAMACGIP